MMDIHSKNNLARLGIILIPLLLGVIGAFFFNSKSGFVIFAVLFSGLALVFMSIGLSFSQKFKCRNCNREIQIGISKMTEANRSVIPEKCDHCGHPTN